MKPGEDVFHQVENNFKGVLKDAKMTVKNTDFLPKKGLFQLTRREKNNDTCWQFHANMNSVFRLEIMHQQKYKYNFFTAV